MLLAQTAGHSDLNIWIFLANTIGAVVVVVLFLRHLRDDRKEQITLEKTRQEVLTHIGEDCHEHSEKMLKAVTVALESANKTIAENSRVLGETNARLVDITSLILRTHDGK